MPDSSLTAASTEKTEKLNTNDANQGEAGNHKRREMNQRLEAKQKWISQWSWTSQELKLKTRTQSSPLRIYLDLFGMIQDLFCQTTPEKKLIVKIYVL